MTSATQVRPEVKRSVRVPEPIRQDGQGTIRITRGDVVEDYALQTFEAYAGEATGVTLTKTDGTHYEVCLSADPAETHCSCPGHTYSRTGSPCKHLLALRLLAERGQLPIVVSSLVGLADLIDGMSAEIRARAALPLPAAPTGGPVGNANHGHVEALPAPAELAAEPAAAVGSNGKRKRVTAAAE